MAFKISKSIFEFQKIVCLYFCVWGIQSLVLFCFFIIFPMRSRVAAGIFFFNHTFYFSVFKQYIFMDQYTVECLVFLHLLACLEVKDKFTKDG